MSKRKIAMSVLFARYAREAPMGEVTLILDIVKDILAERRAQDEAAAAASVPAVPKKRRGRKPGTPNKKVVKDDPADDVPAAVDEPPVRVAPTPPTPRAPRLPGAPKITGGPPPFRGAMPTGAMPPLGGGPGA